MFRTCACMHLAGFFARRWNANSSLVPGLQGTYVQKEKGRPVYLREGCRSGHWFVSLLAQALAVDDMADIKESVDDYLERNQDAFDDFKDPDDVYCDLIEQLDSLEVRRNMDCRQQAMCASQ